MLSVLLNYEALWSLCSNNVGSDNMQNYILFVDDEQSILNAIKRVFRRCEHKVLTATSVSEALQLIHSKPISVLVSDYSMPDQTGAEFLETAKKIRPDMIRIVLSGNGDQDAAIQSINRGAASRFLTKPWDDAVLIQEIENAVQDWEESKFQMSANHAKVGLKFLKKNGEALSVTKNVRH